MCDFFHVRENNNFFERMQEKITDMSFASFAISIVGHVAHLLNSLLLYDVGDSSTSQFSF